MYEVISGSGIQTGAGSALESLEHFYAAFNSRDAQSSGESWARLPEVIMCNPIGGMRKGWDEIYNGYKKIMQGEVEVYVEFYDYTIKEGQDHFIAIGRERGYAKTKSEHIDLAIRTSRFFRKQKGRWFQFHHHGSIDQPELLHAYQQAINS